MAEGGPVTLEVLLRLGRDMLLKAGIPDAALDARLLVERFTGTTRTDAIIDPLRPVDSETSRKILKAFERRTAGEPLHRITGSRQFYGLELSLSPATLEPRPDTETLVDAMLPLVRKTVARRGSCRILDLGTGTGAIALALLSQFPEATATGVDVSAEALATACANAERLGLSVRFSATCSDWFQNVAGLYDVIVSNPPYIPRDDIAGLARDVREHDPRAALDGGGDGLDAYRRIAAEAARFLDDDGTIGLEIGFDQRQAVTSIFEGQGFELLGSAKDLGGDDRVVIFGLPVRSQA
ncbi:peptide chain release factor N(5)-glutamine methyltransferase [Pseudaminobacter sp. 19-2017]|uniref:Release factor glutamine methyltransferase n=1 Tax=Pseudaminobacter soli (ex Zhang et al. 2022) TaxID=2831468 RepID=A0A942E443_9HYPH|nr:peptide chain release factor N(5)-glutamine methyltransferase [Pseudaminobacter soli]MBS3648147.1 peptide chain release factor N(5)-glutamine methyltransferase [Pseudaminobacter soli]